MTVKTITTRSHFDNDQSPVAMIVQVSGHYESSVYLIQGSKSVNAKSIMGMMTLGLAAGENVTVNADGADEEQAIAEIEKYLSAEN